MWNNNADRSADTASIASSSRTQENGDARQVFPCIIHHTGRTGGPYTLYAESAAVRLEWKQKLEEALGLRKVVQESNKVFEIEGLSVDTFLLPTSTIAPNAAAWHDGTLFTGKVTCSVPFSKCPSYRLSHGLTNVFASLDTPDGRGLVAIGCAEGVWIGYRHDSRCKSCSKSWLNIYIQFSYISVATRSSFEDGLTVRHFGRLRPLPRSGG